jgi:hypothetical protein
MKIVIPSHKRVDSMQFTEWIPESFYSQVYIITRKGEQEKIYKETFGDIVNVVSVECNDISTKRNQIAKLFAGEKIWMVDDDCILKNTEITDERYYLEYGETVNEEEFYEFIRFTTKLLDDYPHGIVNPRIFPVHKSKYPYVLNKWGFTNTFLNLGIINAELLDYTFVDHTEDLVAFLNVIEHGYDSFHLLNWLIKSDKPGKPGGMSEVRNSEMMDNSKLKILKKYPQHIGLKKKKYSTGGHTSNITLVVRPNIKRRGESLRSNKLF